MVYCNINGVVTETMFHCKYFAILFRSCSHRLIWLSSLSILSVPNKGYTEKESCALNVISIFLFYYLFDLC